MKVSFALKEDLISIKAKLYFGLYYGDFSVAQDSVGVMQQKLVDDEFRQKEKYVEHQRQEKEMEGTRRTLRALLNDWGDDQLGISKD